MLSRLPRMLRRPLQIRKLDAKDLLIALALVATLLFSFCVHLPTTQYGDGPQLISLASSFDFGPAIYRHAGYLPMVEALRETLEWVDLAPHAGLLLQFFSALWAALGLGACWLILRQLGLTHLASLAAVGLLAFAPVTAFYARVAEVHTLHFANVALVVCLLLGAGQKARPWPAVVLVLGVASTFLTHQTAALLIPGLVALAIWVRGERRDWRSWLAFGFCGGAGLALGIAATLWIRGDTLAQLFGGTEQQVLNDLQLDRLQFVLHDLLLPILALWPFVLVGMARLRRLEPGLLAAIALAFGIEVIFFAWWSVSERGAYMTGYLPLLLIPAGAGIDALKGSRLAYRWWLLGAAIVAQASVGFVLLERFEVAGDPADLERRFEIVDAALTDVPGPKVLLTLDPSRQTPAAVVDELFEKKLVFQIDAAVRAGLTPVAFEALVIQTMPAVLNYQSTMGARVFLDRTYQEFVEFSEAESDYVGAFERALQTVIEVGPMAQGQVWELLEARTDV